jgi:glyoxylase-like metal-dependent hydrolase (beta-lactamase superfamily II)
MVSVLSMGIAGIGRGALPTGDPWQRAYPLGIPLTRGNHSRKLLTYLALSHYHYDHTANANEFAGATWLVRQVERDARFATSARR